MHELDDPKVLKSVIESLKEQLNVSDVTKIASGNEFFIFYAELPYGAVVIKVPKDKVFSNVNDAHIDSRVLLEQEYKLTRHVYAHDVLQVATARKRLDAAGFGALVVDYIPSDDSPPDDYALGQLLAHIHSIAVPDFELSAQEGQVVPELIATRLTRRWAELDKLVPRLPGLPESSLLLSALDETRATRQLLHMDFRQANLRTSKGQVLAVIDWSNALVGHPALELARVAETGETGPSFMEGYATVRPLPVVRPIIETIFRLDTETMLALVFLSENPDPLRVVICVARVRELHSELAALMRAD